MTSSLRRQRVLIISFSHLNSDPRVHRQIIALQDRYEVLAAGLSAPAAAGVQFIPVSWGPRTPVAKALGVARMLMGHYDAHYWSNGAIVNAFEKLRDVMPHAVVANDIDALPLALRVSGASPVLYDAHEYWPARDVSSLAGRLLHSRYRKAMSCKYIPLASSMTTVSEGIARAYEHDTGVKPLVVTNAPAFEPLLQVRKPEPSTIRLVHHGVAARRRQLELMIEMMDSLDDRFTLSLMLTDSDPAYVAELTRRAAGNPRIEFLPPVPMPQISRFLNCFDIGIFILPPTHFNARYALPNKLFEFVQARLGIAIGPSPEMAHVVRHHGLGVVADDFSPSAMADQLNRLTVDDVSRFKMHADQAALVLSAERNIETIRGLLDGLIATDSARHGVAST